LAIEIDGGQHAEPEQRKKDPHRTNVLSEAGINVVRFWNDQVLCDTESVINEIWNALHAGPPCRGRDGPFEPPPAQNPA
jgi:very-short-patch-repair endonuclease